MTAPRPSPKCRALLLEMSRYLDDDLPAARRRSIESHIASCHCCGTMATRLRTVVSACRAEGGAKPPRAVMARAARRIRTLLAAAEGRR